MLHARFAPVPGSRWLLSLQLLVGSLLPLFAQSDQPVYTDSLQNGWANWSWATVNLNNSSPVYSGTSSISITCTNYQALYLHHTVFDSTPYTNLTFWINGGASGGQPLQVQATTNQVALTNHYTIVPPSPNTWQLVTVPLSTLGVAGVPTMDGFWIQSTTSSQLTPFYVDDITLVAGTTPPVTNTPVSINVDAQLNRHPISPLIYGVAFAGSSTQLSDLNSPIHRSGGNSETSYNWQLNAHNHAADWYFESIDDGSATPAASADSFVSTSKTGGAEPMLTIPMIGWVPKLGPSRGKLASYSIAKYGPQTGNDAAYFADAGNGISSTNGNKPITWNDPNDANFATNSTFQQVFVQHLTNRWGLSTNGGVRYYLMDNEHSLWQSTHLDVHPVGPTMQEIRDKIFDYAAKVKGIDPSALVAGPEEWGWSGYFYSGYDQQYGSQHGWSYLPDRAANGGMDYMPWLLSQLYQRATNTNQRLLDYFTLHCYPQSGEFSQTDVSTAMQLLRNRSTRQFWDTNYVDASWINSVVMLIPRMKNWVATYYPGTKIGITEYNWGAEGYINGATAQADLYGIFGREGLDLATRWTTPGPSTPTYKAMKMYRNYDGSDSGFGDTSVNAGGPNPDNLSTFAALRSSDGALTLMVINKQLGVSATAAITVTNRSLSGAGQVWQLTSANAITRLSDITFTGNRFTNTVPPQSITLFVLPAGAAPPPPALRPGSLSRTNTFDLWLDGTSGQRYVLQSTTDLRSWTPVATNILSGSSWHIVLPPSIAPQTFYRGLWTP
ncbi:MAG TPA: glycoside hydrolase family 44 protein [Candidatus Acidoferrum sp.]|nr:glycoside hydrolase family 44 protein [Candidatus Acidoferrum sp.]